MENASLLIESYEEEDFQTSLGSIRLSIEKEMKDFLKCLKVKLKEEQRIFDNIESRIKSIESFTEKIRRKDYIDKWTVSEEKVENQRMICINLPDLIGFRINCFFMKDEEVIYNYLKNYYENSNFSEKIKLNFDENTKQENGHVIYKFTGIYEAEYNFEVQIKSLFHNVWGEVEHKTIYKGRHFDPNVESRKVITEEIFNVLDASDKQLLEMYKTSHKEKQLIQTLFYYQTYNDIKEHFRTDILSKHYHHFFEIFRENKDFELINDYVAKTMLKMKYVKKKPDEFTDTDNVISLSKKILDTFQQYDLDFLYRISSIIFELTDENYFLKYLSHYLITTIYLSDEMQDDEFSDYYDSFSDDHETEDIVNNAIYHLSGILEKRR